MISKYFLWTSVLILNILLFSSCLNSSNDNFGELPSDPQIYAISLSSRTDTTGVLSDVSLTIDQINSKIFNKEPLPYLFHVDSVMLSLSGSNIYYSFAQIEITLDNDCTYTWNRSDSIALPRLTGITTTSPNGANQKEYNFTLNIYQSDPYIISWDKVTGEHLTPPIDGQRTITHGNSFYTYYRSGSTIKAKSATIAEDPQWTEVTTLQGMPDDVRLSSLITSGNTIYALTTSGAVFRSINAIDWSEVATHEYEVKAIYGELPFAGPGNTLLLVNDGGTFKFAKANEGFTMIELMDDMSINVPGNLQSNMPVSDFSAITVESTESFASKFILLSGGTKQDNTSNNHILVLQEADGVISYFSSKKPEETILEGSSLFFYDEQPYLISTTSEGENILFHSRNYGTEWTKTGENQAFPDDFTLRKYTSVITADNNIWIFGGVSSSDTQLMDIWKGKLNKFTQN